MTYLVTSKPNRYLASSKDRVTCRKCRTFLNVGAFSPKHAYVVPQNMGWSLRPESYDEMNGIGEIPEHWVCPRCAEVVDHRAAVNSA